MVDLSNENVIHIKTKKAEYIQFRKLFEYSNQIKHCFTLKNSNKSQKNVLDFGRFKNKKIDLKTVLDSYKIISDVVGFTYKNIIRPVQSHTDGIKIIENIEIYKNKIYPEELENVDSVVTNRKNIVLSTGYADCTPILLFDPKKNVIANIHSGWKGTVKKISSKTAIRMNEEYNCDFKDILVFIFPRIMKCCFEVEEDVEKEFRNTFKSNVIEQKTDLKYMISLGDAIIEDLLEVGIEEKNIYDSKICTACNFENCFSYRKGDKNSGSSVLISELI